MIQGTTPAIVIKVKSDIDLNEMQEIWLTFKRMSKELTLKLSSGDLEIDTSSGLGGSPARRIIAYLKQEHTLFFQQGRLETQLRFLDADNIALASKAVAINLLKVLKEGEIYAD